ncbi:hypothetical protein CDL12_11661 [Handroanthus impetiginosus]|uniref:Uncharacterized protein n=1 Tax=Handroanthus impetiginosus TaxID=429701 RepID=A0A2G9HDU8_9LAMI|nr:hypothetical protein CDL12_11661 [Handroanthus impetiginosus]
MVASGSIIKFSPFFFLNLVLPSLHINDDRRNQIVQQSIIFRMRTTYGIIFKRNFLPRTQHIADPNLLVYQLIFLLPRTCLCILFILIFIIFIYSHSTMVSNLFLFFYLFSFFI